MTELLNFKLNHMKIVKRFVGRFVFDTLVKYAESDNDKESAKAAVQGR